MFQLSLTSLHPLQESLIYNGAIQCGFCTPGLVMSAKTLLDRNPSPSDLEIKEALGGHLCRCGGYTRIIKAVRDAAAVMRGEMDAISLTNPLSSELIGVSVPDVEGVERVSGRLIYADDLSMEGMLYGKLLLSQYPHAEILSVDTSAAEKYPGVRLVLTAKDVPGLNGHGVIVPDQPVFADKKVRFIGDVLAAVFADSLEIAKKAVQLIKVDYRPLEGVFSPFKAMEKNAPKIHDEGNLIKEVYLNSGDIKEGLAKSDVIVEETYFSPFLDHAFMEPEAGVAVTTEDGGVSVWYPTQGPFASRYSIARSLALPEEKVQVIGTPMGGAFGGKTDVTIEIILALGALRSRKPVKITLTRRESLRMHTKRHAYYMHYKTGATKDGKYTALWAKIVSDAGAYASWSADVIEQSMVFAGGPYVWPNTQVEGHCYYTNNVIGGAFRGFGMNQVHFAVESQIDMMAKKLGLDPIDFRLQNALDVGLRTITGEKLKHSVAIKETLRQAKKALSKEKIPVPSGNNKKVGVGIASGYKNIGGGKGFVNHGGAILELKESGEVEARSSACDLGQGVKTSSAQIVSSVTGINLQRINVITGDSSLIPEGAFAIGQRQVMVAGNALLKAAQQFKKELLLRTSQIAGISSEELSIHDALIVDINGNKVLSLAELAQFAGKQGNKVISEYQYVAPQTYPLKGDLNPTYPVMKDDKIIFEYDDEDYRNYIAYNYCTQVAVVEVDGQTGEVQVLKILGFHDVGRAINPQKCLSQLEGSVIMGLGYALTEDFMMHEGMNITNRLEHCGIPTILETPDSEFMLIEDPDPTGPFQAKGMAEIALVPTVPAITNAIHDAVGIRITSLPASPERVRLAIDKKRDVP